jgi:aspartyl-tRNA(Asn)/glutamyl-tRNA(Gln) amidotransferase subunit B
MAQGKGTPAEIVEKFNLRQINDAAEIEAVIDKVMQASPQNVEQYRAGKDKLFGFFVGNVMKETGGRANPDLTNELLLRKLKNI